MSRNHGLYAALFAVALLVQALPNAADAAPPVPNGNITALRAAIANAAPGGTIVLFTNGTYTLDGTQLVITKQITIKGHGATIDGNDQSGVIKIKSTGNLTLRNVIITGGAGHKGGGIDNAGTLTLSGNSSVSGNEADDGGGILNTGTVTMSDTSRVSSNNADVGGGILNGGTLINCIAGGNVVNNTVSDIFNE